ncbi:uncharacterized protein LOC129619109 [Condylostylus longicornis]|uniref:uncharacterized protein LOC129619109 n=1 Tax=Condylostylus longicornis TaxID=2530218 RepID=UPI00244E2FB0|nr:uncharacterized protein LOC129619109 [Condylostylus longicornis]
MPAGRVAGKFGYGESNYFSGRSYKDINNELMWISIGMGITIAILITFALCYILYEKCHSKKQNGGYFINA